MNFDRKAAKHAARDILRNAPRPKPSLVTMIYLLIASFLPFIIFLITMKATEVTNGGFRPGISKNSSNFGVIILFTLLLAMLLAIVISVGYSNYMLKVKRNQPSGVHDLFSGFSMAGRAIGANLLLFLYIILWIIPAIFIMMLFMLPGIIIDSRPLMLIGGIIGEFVMFVYLFNRVARYAFVNFLLWDHVEFTVGQCIRESITMMKGRVRSYAMFYLSFMGWFLLQLLIFYIIGVPTSMIAGSILTSEVAQLVVLLFPMIACLMLSAWINTYFSISFVFFYDADLVPIGNNRNQLRELWEQAPPVPIVDLTSGAPIGNNPSQQREPWEQAPPVPIVVVDLTAGTPIAPNPPQPPVSQNPWRGYNSFPEEPEEDDEPEI